MHGRASHLVVRHASRLTSGHLPRTLKYYPTRSQSSNAPRSAWKQAVTPDSPILVQENFPKHFVFVLDVGWRFIKFSAIGLALLGITVGSAYEGAHIWAEKSGLAPDSDEDVKKWQWDSDADRWTGDPLSGGTDPGLGLRGRHLVRAAWMAYTWGIGHNTSVIGTEDQRGIKLVDSRLQLTEDFLRSALRVAEASQDKLYPNTLPQLFTLHGTMLEKLGIDFVPEAKSDFERAWACLPLKGLDSARVALKIGDLSSRLGSGDEALEWWRRSLQLITEKKYETGTEPLEMLPTAPPSSPLAQRLLSSALVSISAFYAKSKHFKNAESVDEKGLALLRAIRPPDSLTSASPPHALHALYLLQRSSILSVHLAEVLYAQRRPVVSSIQWLTFAAESSERVARALTGLPLKTSDEFYSKNQLPHPLESHLLTSYTSSRSMKAVAEGLLRDARRTAAEAWNMLGLLHQAREGVQSKSALDCFERAVEWAGTPSLSSDDRREAAEGIPDADWKVLWANYQRARTLMEGKK